MASQTNNPQPETPRLDTFQDFLSGIAAQNQQVLLRGNPEKAITRIKAQILGTLRAAELPGCYLRKPVSLLDIRQYCEALNEDKFFWMLAVGELLADGRIGTLSRNGQMLLSLRGPELPDYPGDQRDETDGGMCALPFDEQEQVSGERATSNMATAETDVSAEGQRHRALTEGRSVPSLPAHSTANGTESRYVDPELRAKTSLDKESGLSAQFSAGTQCETAEKGAGVASPAAPAGDDQKETANLQSSPSRSAVNYQPRTRNQIAAVLADQQLKALAAERICDHCKELIPVSSGSVVWRGMLFHLEQGRDCRMAFVVANAEKIDHRTGEFRP